MLKLYFPAVAIDYKGYGHAPTIGRKSPNAPRFPRNAEYCCLIYYVCWVCIVCDNIPSRPGLVRDRGNHKGTVPDAGLTMVCALSLNSARQTGWWGCHVAASYLVHSSMWGDNVVTKHNVSAPPSLSRRISFSTQRKHSCADLEDGDEG